MRIFTGREVLKALLRCYTAVPKEGVKEERRCSLLEVSRVSSASRPVDCNFFFFLIILLFFTFIPISLFGEGLSESFLGLVCEVEVQGGVTGLITRPSLPSRAVNSGKRKNGRVARSLRGTVSPSPVSPQRANGSVAKNLCH